MSIFMQSYDYKMWDVVLNGLYVPIKKKKGSEEFKVETSNRMDRS